jgi:ribosomal-protein-alanine N-acetyltransferase
MFSQSDLENVFKGLSDPKVIPYYGVSFATIEETQKQIDWFLQIEHENTGRWRAITSKDYSQFFGAIGFNYWQQEHRKAEIGFWLMPEFWKKGIIREVLPVMIAFGFKEMQLHRIEAEVESENSSSKKVLEASGFQFEGTKRDCEIKKGRFISLDLFSLLQNDALHDPLSQQRTKP